MSAPAWHVLCIPPIDLFEGMIPLSRYLFPAAPEGAFGSPEKAEDLLSESKRRLAWVSGALNALRRVANKVQWDGSFRHEPYVGSLPWPPDGGQYLVVKQEDNGNCFIISQGFRVPLPLDDQPFSSAVIDEEAGRVLTM